MPAHFHARYSAAARVGLCETSVVPEFANDVFTPQVQDHHLRPGVQQPLGGSQAQARCAAGDDGYGVLDLHASPSPIDQPVGWGLYPLAEYRLDVGRRRGARRLGRRT